MVCIMTLKGQIATMISVKSPPHHKLRTRTRMAYVRNKGRLGDGCPISIGRVFGTESDNDDDDDDNDERESERERERAREIHTHSFTVLARDTHTKRASERERERQREKAPSTKNERPNR